MTKTQRVATMVALILGLAVGCERTPAQEQGRAAEAQREANKQINAAQQEAAKDIVAAKQEAAETVNAADLEAAKGVDEGNRKIADAHGKMGEKAVKAQAAANETIRDAKQEIAVDQDELREWAEAELRDLSKAMDDTSVKAQKAEPELRARIETALLDVRTKSDAIAMEVKSLDANGAQELTRFRKRLDTRLGKLDARVDKLDESL